MGITKCPRPFYFKHGVITYYVKKKQIYYNVLKWDDLGLNQYSIHDEILNNKTPEQILKESLNFSLVGIHN